jgi:predicted metal-dependent hydrolase
MEQRHLLKKKPSEINLSPLNRIAMSDEDWEEFSRGVTLFNEGKFWNAHEAWEEVWRRHQEDERLFFQGIIQLAAAYHHLCLKKSFRSLVNNFAKSYEIIKIFRPEYLGIAIEPVLLAIEAGRKEAETLGPDHFDRFNQALVLKLQFQKPPDPDLQVGICGLLESEEFLEGAKMFNEHYFWEAHELWDRLRQNNEGDTRMFAEGFTQMACAYHFIERRKYANAVYLIEKAVEKLKSFEKQACEYPLSQLIDCMKVTCGEILERGDGTQRDVCVPVVPVPVKNSTGR